MFPKDSQSTVLIAEPYRSKEAFTLLDSKIGGLPLWFTHTPQGYPFQCSCGREMVLIVQLYEPTSDLDRVLYVFACPSPQCQLSSSGWKCLRQQQPAPEETPAPKPAKPAKPAAKSTGLSWDFGASSSLLGEDSDIMSLLTKMETKSPSKPEAPVKHEEPVKNGGPTPTIAPGIPVTDSSRPRIPEYFLDVILTAIPNGQIFDEPAEKKKKVTNVKMEGVMEGEGKEVYDHDKKMSRLLKFNQIIKRNPSQVLRIAYPDGSPLFPSEQVISEVPRCACGAKRVFEVQLLPTLLSFVDLDEEVDLAQLRDSKEWSSVLIYTCEDSCDGEEESVVVLISFRVCFTSLFLC